MTTVSVTSPPHTLGGRDEPLVAQGAPSMSGPSRPARFALGATVLSLLIALVAGALPLLQGASADTTRRLVSVSFRPAGVRSTFGWLSDNGAAFDSRRAYGWVRDDGRNQPVSMAEHATSRSRSRAPRRTETFITMQPPKQAWGRWSLTVEPGTYRVTVMVGDPAGAAGNQTLAVEGKKAVDNFEVSSRSRTTTETVDVRVTDGHLTLDPMYPNRGTKTKLISVQVSEVLGGDTPPTTETPTDPAAHHAASDDPAADHPAAHHPAPDHPAPDHRWPAEHGRLRRRRQVPDRLGRRDQAGARRHGRHRRHLAARRLPLELDRAVQGHLLLGPHGRGHRLGP